MVETEPRFLFACFRRKGETEWQPMLTSASSLDELIELSLWARYLIRTIRELDNDPQFTETHTFGLYDRHDRCHFEILAHPREPGWAPPQKWWLESETA